MALPLPLGVLGIILVALVFDYTNGFHDAANSIATIVSTRVLPPRYAVVWAAFFNFVAFAVFGVHVAKTIAKGTVDPALVTPAIVLAALLSALLWNLLTWWWGLPTSSSHALIGGFVGAAVVAAGPRAVLVAGVMKTITFIVVSPLVGLALGFLGMLAVSWIFRRSTPRGVDTLFRRLQLVSAAAFSLGHGSNDAQKTAGIITALLYSTGNLHGEFHVPLWVVLSSYGAIGLGTLSGGWRIVETMGMRITKLQPVGGFCAETAGAVALFGASAMGIPVSTTHTITGAIVGAGVSASRRLSGVKWGVASRHVYAKVGYDPFKSFSPITMVVTIPTALIVHPSLPVKSVKELVSLAKSRPGQILYSSGGVGSPQHLAMAMFTNIAGADLLHVPYKSAPAATLDLVGGHVQAMFNGLSTPLPHIKSGRLRALAMAGAKHSALLPGVPTVQEAGVAGYVYEQWLALLAPARTPPDIVSRLNAEVVKILATQDVRDILTQQALDALGGPPEDVTKALTADFPRMANLIKQVGIKPE